jgi:arylsulfatase A-like enzyme
MTRSNKAFGGEPACRGASSACPVWTPLASSDALPGHRTIPARLLLLGLLAACGRDDFRNLNVVVVGIDTLRADHVGAYGYPRPTTPRIDAFAGDAVRFQTAVSQAPWTLPGFASMFTGLVPSVHGAGAGRCSDVTVLDDTRDTLATALRAGGYETAAFVSNVWVGAEVGLARGFDHHERQPFSEDAVTSAIAWLRGPHRTPFFLFVHIMDPHQPWVPTPEDAKLFVDPGYHGRVGDWFAGQPKPEWDDADRRQVVALYDGEVRWADRLTGRVLDVLDELGLAKRTIVVVISDHGEELFDHGGLGHGQTLFDEQLLVPFLIRFPGARLRGPIARPVRTMDLFPTVLEAVGQPVPAGLNGVSLMPLLRGGDVRKDYPKIDVALSEFPCFAEDVGTQSLRTPREKLLFHPVSGGMELFDLAADPHETKNVAVERHPDVAALRGLMAEEASPARTGYQLTVQGGTETGVVRARLEAAPSKFRDVALVQPERSDRFRLGQNDQVLDVKLHLTPKRFPARGGDLDGIAFRTEMDLPFVLRSIELNGAPMPLATMVIGNGGAADRVTKLPARFGAATRGLLVRYPVPAPERLEGKAFVQITFVRRASPQKTVITPEMEKHLRAMGYVE